MSADGPRSVVTSRVAKVMKARMAAARLRVVERR